MMTVEGRPPGPGVDLCPHRRPTIDDCPRCDKAAEAAQVARPPRAGPARAVRLIVARHNSDCPRCSRGIIRHQDRIGKLRVDQLGEVWCCEICVKSAAGGA